MQVSKWGNSLAIRLPASIVEALDLKEGDDIEIGLAGDRKFEINRAKDMEWALQVMKRLSKPLPSGWKFDREEANER